MLNFEDPDLFRLSSADPNAEWNDMLRDEPMDFDQSLLFNEDRQEAPVGNPVETQLSLELETEMFFERLHKNYAVVKDLDMPIQMTPQGKPNILLKCKPNSSCVSVAAVSVRNKAKGTVELKEYCSTSDCMSNSDGDSDFHCCQTKTDTDLHVTAEPKKVEEAPKPKEAGCCCSISNKLQDLPSETKSDKACCQEKIPLLPAFQHVEILAAKPVPAPPVEPLKNKPQRNGWSNFQVRRACFRGFSNYFKKKFQPLN